MHHFCIDKIHKEQFITLQQRMARFECQTASGGAFDACLVRVMEDMVFRPQTGHPNQIPSIVTWRGLIEDLLSWVKSFIPPAGQDTGSREEISIWQGHPAPSALPIPTVLQGGNTEEGIFSSPLYTPPQPWVAASSSPRGASYAPCRSHAGGGRRTSERH